MRGNKSASLATLNRIAFPVADGWPLLYAKEQVPAVYDEFLAHIITLAGINSEPNATQDPKVIHRLRRFNSYLPLFFVMISLVCGMMYPLDENRMTKVRNALHHNKTN
jgi:hypothetical protein